jgi:molecular chaperone DnaJ
MEGMPETYYELLGVRRNASDREIKDAYRVLARQLHPDVSREAGAEERFKGVNEAYRVLSNPVERGRYDTLGHEKYRKSPPGSTDPSHPRGAGDAPPGSDIFDLFFSERSWGPAQAFRPRGCSDLLVRVPVSFEEALLGSERVIEVPSASRCTTCGGTGSRTGKAGPCPRCGGSGREEAGGRGSTGNGPAPCRECGGRGRIPESRCTSCDGWGEIQETKRVTVRIPPGIDNGMRIRKEGLGSREDGIPSGDLYVEVTVLPHPRFTRKGDDLETPVHLSPARAALGSVITVETVDGRSIRVEIPLGVQHEGSVRVPGEGVKARDRAGDLVLRIWIDTPEKITAEERDLYRQLVRIEERKEEKKGVISGYLSWLKGPGR